MGRGASAKAGGESRMKELYELGRQASTTHESPVPPLTTTPLIVYTYGH
jgi:hypothetical protein